MVELPVGLAEGASLAKEVDGPVRGWRLHQAELVPQLRPVRARVDARHPDERPYQRVQYRSGRTGCNIAARSVSLSSVHWDELTELQEKYTNKDKWVSLTGLAIVDNLCNLTERQAGEQEGYDSWKYETRQYQSPSESRENTRLE